MATKAKCPECVKENKRGENTYVREDGTFKCRTCGYDSKKRNMNKQKDCEN